MILTNDENDYDKGTITITSTTCSPYPAIFPHYADIPAIKCFPEFIEKKEYINYKLPKKYIINEKVCVLVWEDGSYTKVVKCPEDKHDPVKAFLWAWFRHTCGLPKWKANKYLGEIAENCAVKKPTKKKKEIIEEL